MKKIILVTSGQPSLNPRLVKEADTLVSAGYDVKVIYQYWNQWGTELDRQLLPMKKWRAICVGGSPNSRKFVFIFCRMLHKIASILAKTNLNFGIAEYSISRSSYFLYREAKRHRADLYIGHNLGAISSVVKAAEFHGTKAGFDAEDFHRNEISNLTINFDVKLRTFLEHKYFPRLHYLTTSSSLISDEYQKLFPELHITSILNVFPQPHLPSIRLKAGGPLKLFWFSQTIGKNRGLEEVISAIANMKNIELHLLGYLRKSDYNYFSSVLQKNSFTSEKVFFYPPIPSTEIITFAAKFDVGLAIETGEPYNRDICLTNKIFTYVQAGLSIVASDTKAQRQLIRQYPTIGSTYKRRDIDQLKSILTSLQLDTSLLTAQKSAALKLAKDSLNWEQESIRFLKIVDNLFD